MTIKSLEGMKVVAIDDEAVLLTIVQSILSSHGAIVYGAKSAERGMTLIKEKLPELVVLDRYLQNDDGLAILKHMRKTAATKDIPVLMLTGENRISKVDEAISAGSDWYVVKPFQPKTLVDRAIQAMNREKPKLSDDGKEVELTFR